MFSLMSILSTKILPELGISNPKIMSDKVLFPAPLFPIIPILSPLLIENVILDNASLDAFG